MYTLGLRLKAPKKPSSSNLRLDVGRLEDPEVAQVYADGLVAALGEPRVNEGPEVLWTAFKTGILDVASGCIPKAPRRARDGMSAETVEIIDESRRARLDGKKGLYKDLRRKAVKSIREDAERRVQEVCLQVECHLGTADARPAYMALRKLRSGKSSQRDCTVKAADGKILVEESEVKARWAGYFEELFNVDPPSRTLPDEGAAAVVAEPPLCCDPPSLEETQRALDQLKGGKAPGVCGIHAEMLKAGGETTLKWLHALVCSVWSTGVVPTDWKRGLIVPIWKGKGDSRECNNYRGVTLLSVPGKVFARILLNRVRQLLLEHQRPEQSGFTPKRSTVDRILGLRVLTERRLEFNKGLLAAYIDFKKAFDSVNRDALWRVLELRGIPSRLIDLISALYSGTESAVKCGASTSDFFPVKSGVRQGCVFGTVLVQHLYGLYYGEIDW